MSNFLKRNDDGSILRICHFPDEVYGKQFVNYGCFGCKNRTKCNQAIFERLAQFEEIGYEPEELKAMKNNYSDTVTEVCPHCESEITMVWDIKTMGYLAHCPVCGERMMLCDECIHAEDGLNAHCSHCDWNEYEDENGNPACFRCSYERKTS